MSEANTNTVEEKALFIPLKREFFEAFKRGEKVFEYREYGARWNVETCRVGRAGTLAIGYGKAQRLHGVVASFKIDISPYKLPGWCACYGDSNKSAAVIGIRLNKICQHVTTETRTGFCYDELRCVECGAYLGEPVSL